MRLPLRIMKFLGFFILIYVVTTESAEAANYYISRAGTDNNSCAVAMNPLTPKRNFNGITGALACLSSGDTLIVAAGTYREAIYALYITPGTPGNYTKIHGAPGATVIIQPSGIYGRVIEADSADGYGSSYVEFDNLVLDGINVGYDCVKINTNSHHFRIQNSEIKNCGGNGVLVGGATGSNEFLNNDIHDVGRIYYYPFPAGHGFYIANNSNIIDGNRIHNIESYPGPSNGGIQIYCDCVDAHHNRVSNNFIYSISGGGVYMSRGDGNVAYNNVVAKAGSGFMIDNSCINCALYNNTAYGNTRYLANSFGIGVQGSGGPTNSIVRNNITYGNFLDWVLDDGVNTVLSNNLCGAAGTGCAIVGNPLFVDAAANNFQLSSGSPAIDAGYTLSGIVGTDVQGIARPQGSGYDIGAFEYQTNVGSNAAAPKILRSVP